MKKIILILLITLCLTGVTGCSSSKIDQIYNQYKNSSFIHVERNVQERDLEAYFCIGVDEIDSSIEDKDKYVSELFLNSFNDIRELLGIETIDKLNISPILWARWCGNISEGPDKYEIEYWPDIYYDGEYYRFDLLINKE